MFHSDCSWEFYYLHASLVVEAHGKGLIVSVTLVSTTIATG